MCDEERTLIVLRPAGGDHYALAVDRIHDHEELVVKPAAPAVMATGLYAGTTLADDGSPILLFDPAGLAQVGGIKLEAQERATRVAEAIAGDGAAKSVPVLLFRALDGSRRALRLAIVDRIEEVPVRSVTSAAGQLRVQLGHTILPLAGVPAGGVTGKKVRLFRLNDGRQEIGFAFQEVIDLSEIAHEVIPASVPGEISGVTLIGDEPAEMVDPHWLFAHHGGSVAGGAEPLVCRLPAADPWMQNMLRPIVEAAGYRVVGESDDVEPDLVIISEDGSPPEGEAARVIRLRTEPEAGESDDNSIYRYDRAGLLIALKAAGGGRG
jgi:two-component system chemotaxis sensor kinase CheA